MKSSTRDRAKGRVKELAGKTKKAVGRKVGRPEWEEEGAVEEFGGKAQRKVGEIKKVLGK